LEVSNLISKPANQDGSSLRNSVYVGGAVRADFFDENLACSAGAACDFVALPNKYFLLHPPAGIAVCKGFFYLTVLLRF
jgi:hypothetical protein